jgi:hypothetical protein
MTAANFQASLKLVLQSEGGNDRYGHWRLAAIDTRDLKAWYRDWSAGGKVASGHAFIGQLRTLLTHGVLLLPDGPEREQCRRIKELLSGMKFPQPAPREERLTAEQAVAIRAAAHEHFGWPSIALAQAWPWNVDSGSVWKSAITRAKVPSSGSVTATGGSSKRALPSSISQPASV